MLFLSHATQEDNDFARWRAYHSKEIGKGGESRYLPSMFWIERGCDA
jgi:hypothetical protein